MWTKEQRHEYYMHNKDKYKSGPCREGYHKDYYKKNREKIKKQRKLWYERTKEEHLVSRKKYRQEHQEETKAFLKQWHYSNRQQWINLFKELNVTQCANCGYNKCFNAIDFHHMNPEEKEFIISPLLVKKFTKERVELVMNELKKCIPLCANCHRELHSNTKVDN